MADQKEIKRLQKEYADACAAGNWKSAERIGEQINRLKTEKSKKK